MQKIKVLMRCKFESIKHGMGSFQNPYNAQLRITLTPEPVQQSFNLSSYEADSADYVQLVFDRYMQNFLKVDMQNLYAIRHLLTSAKVDNASDMLTLTKQLLPMLDEVIAQTDPDNYELEIIR